MGEIVAGADAQSGSLQHYFPEGKAKIVSEALLMMGGAAARRVGRALDQAAQTIVEIARHWK